MVQFRILSGKKAGTAWVARRFPVRIGRDAKAGLRLEEDGVWDQHLLIELDLAEGFLLRAQPSALVQVNGERVEQTVLRNGDTIEIGAAKLQFWLAETGQSRLGLREGLTWAGIGLVTLLELGLLYWLAGF